MNSEDRVSAVKGIGAKTESHLARIGIYTVGDFIEHYPREYHTYDVPISIDNTEFDNCRQYGYSVVLSEIPKLLKRGRTAIVSVMLHEGTASVQAVWYHSPYIRQQRILFFCINIRMFKNSPTALSYDFPIKNNMRCFRKAFSRSMV